MTHRSRLILFQIGAIPLAIFYFVISMRIPGLGHYAGPYGDLINSLVVSARHVTDAVTAVNFDFRGIDTLGEEAILFSSVIGAVVLLREEKERSKEICPDQANDRAHIPGPSDAIRVWTLGITAPTVLFGIYVVTHGQLTPGGGFQGGVILATAPLLIYLATDYPTFKGISSHYLVEAGEAIGFGCFALLGILPLFWGAHFLENILDHGTPGSVFSGGTIPLIDLSTGLAVAGGFVLLLTAFLQELLAKPREKEQEEEGDS
jgi:multicomponent Na+:H+ antiporter subunit B